MKYNIRLKLSILIISVLAGAGSFGLMHEIILMIGSLPSVGVIILIVLSLTITILVSQYMKTELSHMFIHQYQHRLNSHKICDDFGQNNKNIFEKRMKTIMNIANENMNKAHYGRVFPVRNNVVVSYNDLLKIWDIAERAKADTVVG